MSDSTSHVAEAKLGEKSSEAATAQPPGSEIAAPKAAATETRPEVKKEVQRASVVPWAQAAVLAAAVGVGGWASFTARQPADPLTERMRKVDWAGLAAGIEKTEVEAKRMAAEMQTFKASLDLLRDVVEDSKQESATRLTHLTERLGRAEQASDVTSAKLANFLEVVERTDRNAGEKLTAIAERLEKVEHADPRLAEMAERLERMERQMSAATAVKPAGTVSTDPAERTGTVEANPPTIPGWVLRDVYRGVALIEGRNHRLIEIVPGQSLPGVGRIEAIERRGKSWVVVTSRGIITSQQW